MNSFSATSNSCPKCNEKDSIVEDTMGLELTLVCSNCGYFTATSQISENVDTFPTNQIGNSWQSNNVQTRRNRTLGKCENDKSMLHKKLISLIKKVGSEVNSPKFVIEKALNYLNVSFTLKKFSGSKLKNTLAAVCFYQALIDDDIIKTIRHLCFQFDVPTRKFMRVHSIFKEFVTQNTSAKNLSAATNSVGLIKNIEEICYEFDYVKDHKDLIKTAGSLFIIFKEHGYVNCHNKWAAFISSYFAYLSKQRLEYYTLTKFAVLNGITTVQSCHRQAIKKCKTLLIRLASKLPWVHIEINETNYHLFIPDIIKCKRMLKMEVEEDINKANKKIEEGQINFKDFLAEGAEIDSALLSEEIGEEDISSALMHKYIRSTREVKIIQSSVK